MKLLILRAQDVFAERGAVRATAGSVLGRGAVHAAFLIIGQARCGESRKLRLIYGSSAWLWRLWGGRWSGFTAGTTEAMEAMQATEAERWRGDARSRRWQLATSHGQRRRARLS